MQVCWILRKAYVLASRWRCVVAVLLRDVLCIDNFFLLCNFCIGVGATTHLLCSCVTYLENLNCLQGAEF